MVADQLPQRLMPQFPQPGLKTGSMPGNSSSGKGRVPRAGTRDVAAGPTLSCSVPSQKPDDDIRCPLNLLKSQVFLGNKTYAAIGSKVAAGLAGSSAVFRPSGRWPCFRNSDFRSQQLF